MVPLMGPREKKPSAKVASKRKASQEQTETKKARKSNKEEYKSQRKMDDFVATSSVFVFSCGFVDDLGPPSPSVD